MRSNAGMANRQGDVDLRDVPLLALWLEPSHYSYLPAYEDGRECSETLAYKIQTPGNYPEESVQH